MEFKKLEPLPSRNYWDLTDQEKHFLDATLIFDIPIATLYVRMLTSKVTQAQAKTRSSQLVLSENAQEYLAARRKWINVHWMGNTADDSENPPVSEIAVENASESKRIRLTDEERYDKIEEEIDKIILNPTKEDDAFIQKMYLRFIGIKDKETEEPPMRLYNPTTCRTCGYKKFCDTNGEVLCEDCRWYHHAKSHGMTEPFDYTNILENKERGVD